MLGKSKSFSDNICRCSDAAKGLHLCFSLSTKCARLGEYSIILRQKWVTPSFQGCPSAVETLEMQTACPCCWNCTETICGNPLTSKTHLNNVGVRGYWPERALSQKVNQNTTKMCSWWTTGGGPQEKALGDLIPALCLWGSIFHHTLSLLWPGELLVSSCPGSGKIKD